MALNLNFTCYEVTNSFEPIPAGFYIAQIITAELKPTKAGNGTLLQLTWKILDGQYAGRLVFDRINRTNPNPAAEKIGNDQLSMLGFAIKSIRLDNENDLLNRPCRIKVTIKKSDQYGDSNDIKGYEAIAGANPSAPAFMAPPVSKPAAGAPPWAKAA